MGKQRPIMLETPGLTAVLARARKLASIREPILLSGETGVGKDLLSRWIHDQSPNAKAPFVSVNCSAIPASLFEAEFLGHRDGAFTGATRTRRGKVRLAEDGTLFLNEIGDLAPDLQAKLLDILDGNELYPIGGGTPFRLRARVVAASNRNLLAACCEGHFRQDLYYRLSGDTAFHLVIPPLRQRPDDILQFAKHFLDCECDREERRPVLGRRGRQALLSHPWPGNVRELRKVVLGSLVLAQEANLTEIEIHLPREITSTFEHSSSFSACSGSRDLAQEILVELSKAGALSRAKIAARLGRNESTIRRTAKQMIAAGILEAIGAGRGSRVRAVNVGHARGAPCESGQ